MLSTKAPGCNAVPHPCIVSLAPNRCPGGFPPAALGAAQGREKWWLLGKLALGSSMVAMGRWTQTQVEIWPWRRT